MRVWAAPRSGLDVCSPYVILEVNARSQQEETKQVVFQNKKSKKK